MKAEIYLSLEEQEFHCLRNVINLCFTWLYFLKNVNRKIRCFKRIIKNNLGTPLVNKISQAVGLCTVSLNSISRRCDDKVISQYSVLLKKYKKNFDMHYIYL